MHSHRILRPQTLQKELQGHEPRVEELLGRRGGLARPAERVRELREAWQELRLQAELRHQRLERAHAAQQFYCDAAEAEAWMGEQELHMMAQEKAKVRPPGGSRIPQRPPRSHPEPLCPPLQDELSAQAMVSKHLVLEQALRDYAHTVHQLSVQSRDMVAAGHPERWVPTPTSPLPPSFLPLPPGGASPGPVQPPLTPGVPAASG